jgi:hypothetical protein
LANVSTSKFDDLETNQKKWIDGLSDKERFGFEIYSGNDYAELNGHLRGIWQVSDDTKTLATAMEKQMNQAMERAPKFNGTSYRSMSFTNDVAYQNFIKPLRQRDAIFTDSGFMSTSYSLEKAQQFGGGLRTIEMHVKSKNGVAMWKLSEHPKELEILFKTNSNFEIDQVMEINEKKTIIAMTEI